jgi:hypothetical protein
MNGALKLRPFDQTVNFLCDPLLSTHIARTVRVYNEGFGDCPVIGKEEALATDTKTIFHYKRLNTNWAHDSTTVVLFLSAFHYLGVTRVEPFHPPPHLFDFFFGVIEMYCACAE